MNRLIVDLSSLCWTSLLKGKDEEFGRRVFHEGKEVWVNSAQYGYERAMQMLVDAMQGFDVTPAETILVREGMNTKAMRKAWLPQYKETRDSRPQEAYDQFNLLVKMLIDALAPVGVAVATQDGVEADDIVAYLAEGLSGNRYILSQDKDLAVLVGERKNGFVHQLRMGAVDENPHGPWDHKYITLFLGLVGDTSDNVPGAKGYGEKAFLDTMITFGDEGMDALVEMLEKEAAHLTVRGKTDGQWLKTLAEDVHECKPLQKILDNIDMTVRSYAVVKLRPEKVNTMRNPLKWQLHIVKGTVTDERLKRWAGTVTLVTANNYQSVISKLEGQFRKSPFVALDIETSTPDESDEWLGRAAEELDEGGRKKQKVDVLGSELTGTGITFGENSQHTIYVSVDHRDTPNVSSDDCRKVVELVPREVPIAVHNFSFEGPVLYMAWGEKWKDDPDYHGFLPNVEDTAILASYVDENKSRGLKSIAQDLFCYEQETYEHVTSMTASPAALPPGGRVTKAARLDEALGEIVETRQYKMRELTARHVLSYGADDTIVTAAAYRHFRRVMELENTWHVYKEVEVWPAYLTNLAYVQGTRISPRRLREITEEDDVAYEKAWAVVREYLISIGWEGVTCPVYHELSPANIKDALYRLTGVEFTSRKRKVDALAAEIRGMLDGDRNAFEGLAEANDEDILLFASMLEKGSLDQINDWVKSRHTGEPILDINSPKKMAGLLYDTMGLRIQLVNDPTAMDFKTNSELVGAISRHKKIWAGDKGTVLREGDAEHIRKKAKADDKAVQFALIDPDTPKHLIPVIEALVEMKKIDTRRKLYYRPYKYVRHWKDSLVHAQSNQCEAVTRRSSYSGPNLQQIAKKGEGVKVRGVFVPHHRDAVICSIDFNGQELRLMAGQSLDENMMACYVGDKKKDIHSITAAGAMTKKWGEERVTHLVGKYCTDIKAGPDYDYEVFRRLYKDLDDTDPKVAKEADDLRKVAKNVNFAAQFDAMAPKIAQTIIVSVSDAQMFLDAKYAMFPRVETWKEEVRAELQSKGYVTTLLGARRHLGRVIATGSRGEAAKAGRQGPNFKIQGSAAEMTKLAMGRVWRDGCLFRLDMRFIAPIHDELVWSVHRDHALESIKAVHKAMTVPYADLPVPIVGSISLGPNFGHQIECGEEIDEERINKAIASCFPEGVAVEEEAEAA